MSAPAAIPPAMPMRIETANGLQAVLDAIEFAPSCVDMGWGWEIEPVYGGEMVTVMPLGFQRHGLIGWNVRTTFQRPDTDTGEIGTGVGRWWFVSHGSSASGVVKTAWLACKQIVEHELMEAFMFMGSRVFNPHADIFDLADLNRRNS